MRRASSGIASVSVLYCVRRRRGRRWLVQGRVGRREASRSTAEEVRHRWHETRVVLCASGWCMWLSDSWTLYRGLLGTCLMPARRDGSARHAPTRTHEQNCSKCTGAPRAAKRARMSLCLSVLGCDGRTAIVDRRACAPRAPPHPASLMSHRVAEMAALASCVRGQSARACAAHRGEARQAHERVPVHDAPPPLPFAQMSAKKSAASEGSGSKVWVRA